MNEPTTLPTTRSISIGARAAPPSHLVVLLHGVGADAASFQDVARALSASLPHAEFLVPDGLDAFDGGGTGRQWFSVRGVTPENRPARVREGSARVSKWIDAELARRGLPADRLVVGGFSQGAIVAAWLGVHREPRPAAVLMLSGRVADDEKPVVGSGPRVFMGHGDRDPVMPVEEVASGASALDAWGAHVTTRIYPGLGHQIDARELRDLREFLSALDDR
jgi:phospholipase/carboxylesterase